MRTRLLVWVGAALAAGVSLGAAPQPAAESPPTPGVEAVTRPSADILLKFEQPGRIAAVRVKDGDAVKPGDLLVQLDDEAERLKLTQLKAVADDVLHIKAAEAQVAQNKADLKKLEWAAEQGAATEWEVDRARLEITIGELSKDKAVFNKERAQDDYEQAKVRVDRMKKVSPIAGRVEHVFVEEGESVEALGDVIRVVKTDPLWIDAPVPLERAKRLKAGDAVPVAFLRPVGASGKEEFVEEERTEGKVTFVSAVSDSAAAALTVRVEVPNPKGRPAGETVRVMVGAAPAAAAKP
jgi:RND family efflux transporter MFP subunit